MKRSYVGKSEGKTVVVVFVEDILAGIIAVADTIRDDAKEAIVKLKPVDWKIYGNGGTIQYSHSGVGIPRP